MCADGYKIQPGLCIITSFKTDGFTVVFHTAVFAMNIQKIGILTKQPFEENCTPKAQRPERLQKK